MAQPDVTKLDYEPKRPRRRSRLLPTPGELRTLGKWLLIWAAVSWGLAAAFGLVVLIDWLLRSMGWIST